MTLADPVVLAKSFLAGFKGRREDALSVLCGAIGDRLADAGSSLALPMTVLEPADKGSTACVFVHGLMGSPRAWVAGEVDYGTELTQALGVTPLYVHYNSGLHISTNGRALAAELDRTCGDFDEVALVCHSMGGLVARSACHYALEAGYSWVERVKRVFLLGVPSHGAPLEQLVHVAAFTLDAIWNPWTKLVGKAMNLRSAGIKDLRHGFVLDEDWRHIDVDQLRLAQPRAAAYPPNARWHVAVGALGGKAAALSKILGDGLVRSGSAQGHGFGSPDGVLPEAEVRTFESTPHIALMTDRAVLDQIIEWWST